MKHLTMKFSVFRLPLVALMVCALGARAAERTPAEPLNPAESAPRQFSIDFPGGTVRDFLTAVSKNDGVSISIIAASDPADLGAPLPPFSLRNINTMTAEQVLARMLNARGYDLTLVSGDPYSNSVVAVLSRIEKKPVVVRMPSSRFESFQLGPYLADQSIDDIVGAIRMAWELDPQHDPKALNLKFHPQTAILLMSGPPEGLELAMKIISQLKRSAKNDPKPAQKTPPPEAEKR